LASGYLIALSYERPELSEYETKTQYELALTNYEVMRMFHLEFNVCNKARS